MKGISLTEFHRLQGTEPNRDAFKTVTKDEMRALLSGEPAPKRPRKPAPSAEDVLWLQLEASGMEGWEREYKFDERRRWRIDFARPKILLPGASGGRGWLAVEVEGVTGIQEVLDEETGETKHHAGRHQNKDGFEKDIEKYEALLFAGGLLYRTTPKRVRNGTAFDVIERLVTGEY